MTTLEHSAALACHPASRTGEVKAIHVRVRRPASDRLELAFRLQGDLARIRVPAPRPEGPGARLWEHTCFEAFLGLEGRPGYHELNFSPSGEWAAYRFRDYREADPVASVRIAPRLTVGMAESSLELAAVVRLADLSALHPRSPLCIGLSA